MPIDSRIKEDREGRLYCDCCLKPIEEDTGTAIADFNSWTFKLIKKFQDCPCWSEEESA